MRLFDPARQRRPQIQLVNDREQAVHLFVEKWAEDHTLLPAELLQLSLDYSRRDAWIRLDYGERQIIRWAEGGCERVTVSEGGVELSCGYQRDHWTKSCQEAGVPGGY